MSKLTLWPSLRPRPASAHAVLMMVLSFATPDERLCRWRRRDRGGRTDAGGCARKARASCRTNPQRRHVRSNEFETELIRRQPIGP